MNGIRRLLHEYSNLASVLRPADTAQVLLQTMLHAQSVLKTGKLTPVDRAMSRDVTVHFHDAQLRIPVREMDGHLAASNDSPTFCGIREMLANDVYLRAFRQPLDCPVIVDMGSNRGMFSLVASVVLGAKQIIEIEPDQKYETVRDLLRARNAVQGELKRYWKFVGTSRQEHDESNYVSMNTVVRENNLLSIDFAKIDIEGGEADIFQESEWLSITQNFAAELHPEWVDVRPVLESALRSGFEVRATDQFGAACGIEHAMFLYGSRTGALKG